MATYTNDQINAIFDRTDGKCHICRKKLAFKNYGVVGARAAWEVEHSNAKANGGTNHMNNLFPACISCNRSKGASSTRAARAKHGHTKAPLSAATKERLKKESAVAGGAIGGAIGLLGGPVAALIGTAIGAGLGYSGDPE